MARTLADLSADERRAYAVWQSKLSDRTLSKEQHEQAKHQIDKILRRGYAGQVEDFRDTVTELRDQMDNVLDRLTQLEQFTLTNPAPAGRLRTHGEDSATPHRAEDEAAASFPADNVVRADCGNTIMAAPADKAEVVPAETAPKVYHDGDGVIRDVATGKPPSQRTGGASQSPKKETRGRKKLRFHPEKDANKKWHVLDREAGVWTDHGPYKTRREAKEMCDTLNNMPTAPAISTPLSREAEASVDVTEETPAGAPVDSSEGAIGTVVSRVTDDPAKTIIQNEAEGSDVTLEDLGL